MLRKPKGVTAKLRAAKRRQTALHDAHNECHWRRQQLS